MLFRCITGILVLASLITGAIPVASAQDNPSPSKPPQEIVGIWLGTLEAGGERLRVVFKISKDANGALVATTDSPDRGRKDERVNTIRWQDGSLHLEGVRDRVFDGVLSQDGQELVGEWRQSGYRLPLTLRRVEQAPEFPALPFAAGLYVAAFLTSFLSLLLVGGFILTGTPRQDRLFFVAVMALNLPMSAIAFYWVRLPLDHLLDHTLGSDSRINAAWGILNAPVTEELAKLWLLLLPWFRRRLSKENAPRLGMAIGLGFGVGEAWLVVSLISTDPNIASIPWYLFGTLNGYMSERFMVCIHHGAFTAAALRVIRQTPGRGILYAMGLHFIGNFPLALAGWNFGDLGASAWDVIGRLWLVLFFFAMIALLIRFFKSANPQGWRGLRHYLLGQAKCPECGLVYQRPWLAVNMGTRRYEQCPGCKKWHMTTKLRDPELT